MPYVIAIAIGLAELVIIRDALYAVQAYGVVNLKSDQSP